METTFRPLTARQREDLEGYVSFAPNAFRAALFVIAVAMVGVLFRALYIKLGRSSVDSDLVWIVPTALFAMALYRRGSRWTGGAEFRAAVRRDLARGDAAVHRVIAVDAVELVEREDEGPAFAILTHDGATMVFAGQYLEPYRTKGFPWTAFDILETPESRIFLRLERAGDPLAPSARHAEFTGGDLHDQRTSPRNYAVVDLDFDALKQGVLSKRH